MESEFDELSEMPDLDDDLFEVDDDFTTTPEEYASRIARGYDEAALRGW